MTAALRLIDTGVKSARWNVAMTATLAELHAALRISDTLRFHVYPRSVLLGRHQPLVQAVEGNFCARNNIELARRVTGGGAVYMSPGVLAWDLVMSRRSFGALDRASATICAAVAGGLSRLGLVARFRPKNDIEVGGRKVSGSSGYSDGSSLIHQGTVLIDVDFEEMAAALGFPPRHLREHLATVRGTLGRTPELDEVKRAIGEGISRALGRPLVDGMISADERAVAGRHYQELGSDSFVESGEMGVTPPVTHPAAQERNL